ncbi:MAG: hypothetical protein ABSG92_02055 [Conexivisphaerales archaeon]|jgi:hypothetical protein
MKASVGVKEKLLLLRALVESAAYNSAVDARFNQMLSILEAHQALEWTFRSILREKGHAVGFTGQYLDGIDKMKFANLVEDAKKVVDRVAPDSALSAEQLNLVWAVENARNAIYHQALIDSDVSGRVGDVEQLIVTLCEDVIGVPWKDLSLALQIKNQPWRETALASEDAIARGDYVASIEMSGQLVEDVLADWATVAGEVGALWLSAAFGSDSTDLLQKMLKPDEYAMGYPPSKMRALALDVSQAVYHLHFLVDTLTMLDEEERVKYLKLIKARARVRATPRSELQVPSPAVAIEASDFAIQLTLKYERLKLSYVGP